MTRHNSKTFLQTAAIALVLPSVALAELSALEVWKSWKSYAEQAGQTVSVGSQNTSGGVLMLNDVSMVVEFPDGRAASTIEFLEFRELGDGTVAITMAPDLPMSITVDPAIGDAVDLAMIIRQTGVSIIASGDPDDISFAYLASEISIAVDRIVVGGESIHTEIRLALGDVSGQSGLSTGGVYSYASKMSAGTMDYTVNLSEPGGVGRFAMSGNVLDLATSSFASIPDGMDMDDPAALFDGGFAASGSFSAGQSTSQVTIEDGDDSVAFASTSDSSALSFSIGNGSIQYGINATGVDYSVRSSLLPFPEINLGLSEMALNLLMPLTKSDEPQDFGFLVKFTDFEIDDFLWLILDSGNSLPHDPFRLNIDLSGKANWIDDVSNPEDIKGFPLEFSSLSINDISLSMLGFDLSSNGEFIKSEFSQLGGALRALEEGNLHIELSNFKPFLDFTQTLMYGDPDSGNRNIYVKLGYETVPGSFSSFEQAEAGVDLRVFDFRTLTAQEAKDYITDRSYQGILNGQPRYHSSWFPLSLLRWLDGR